MSQKKKSKLSFIPDPWGMRKVSVHTVHESFDYTLPPDNKRSLSKISGIEEKPQEPALKQSLNTILKNIEARKQKHEIL